MLVWVDNSSDVYVLAFVAQRDPGGIASANRYGPAPSEAQEAPAASALPMKRM
jgi:hypothetical protein